jgi:hypothetical protein
MKDSREGAVKMVTEDGLSGGTRRLSLPKSTLERWGEESFKEGETGRDLQGSTFSPELESELQK